MKSTICLLFVFLIATIVAHGQKVKLYGYAQKVVEGNVATRELNEDGTQQEIAAGTTENYFLYLAGPAKSRIYAIEGWLKGERVGIVSKRVSTPVMLSSSVPADEPIQLVPKKQGTVWQLTTVSAAASKATQKGKSLAAANDLVVAYRLHGKLAYATLKKLKEITAAYMQ